MNNNNVETEYNTLKELVGYVLESYPETRDNDAKLYVQVCRELNLNTLQQIYDYGIAPTSVTRVRQQLQNGENKWVASDEIKELRKSRQQGFHSLMKKLKEAN